VRHELTQESVLPPEKVTRSLTRTLILILILTLTLTLLFDIDKVLHVDNGVMMTYRVTYGDEAKALYKKVHR